MKGQLFAHKSDFDDEAGTGLPTATESLANSSVYKELVDDDGVVRLFEPDESKPAKVKAPSDASQSGTTHYSLTFNKLSV